ncbi:carboxypeptidase-like regulatory domain-containing protein, partial [Lactiplantibacillus plantarum]|uniref:carboxypeptidase-like regulatory domain-containing protein n=1 Tax=Lactiplantibacillus plantarum TaxID=1590 RepID=UPI001650D874
VVTPLKTLMGFSVHLNVQLKFYNLPFLIAIVLFIVSTIGWIFKKAKGKELSKWKKTSIYSIVVVFLSFALLLFAGIKSTSTSSNGKSNVRNTTVSVSLYQNKVDNVTTVKGTATPGATVHFKPTSEDGISDTVKANKKGKFSDDYLVSGKYTVYATYHGYKSPKSQLTITEYKDSDSSSSSSDSSSDASDSYNATEGENNAEKYTYGDFAKSDDWVGKSYHISKAEVLQADEKDGQTVLLVYTDDDPDHTFMVAYDGKTPAVEDDYVDIQGIFSKRQSYDTKIGGSNTVPSLVASKITVTGKDSD